MPFTDTIPIMTALKARMSALKWTPPVDGAIEEPLFDRVEFYNTPDILQGFAELRIFKKRICLIIPSNDNYENERSGPSLITRLERTIILLISDRDFGNRQHASTGDKNNPSVLEMNRLVINDVIGKNLGFLGCLVQPKSAGEVTITGQARDDSAGRLAWSIELGVLAGELITSTRK